MKSSKKTLYKNHKNNIGTWTIWFDAGVIHIEHASAIGGKAVHHTERVEKGLQSRTLQEQVISRIKSRISKQRDKGYVDTIEQASVAPTNAIGLIQPMLAQPIKRISSINWENTFLQPKLDGHRCLITKQNGRVLAYSRQGKPIETINHILKNLNVPEGMTLDGELYVHGVPLQTIASWAKRLQDNTLRLSYNIYDIISDEPFGNRLHFMSTLLDVDGETSVLVPTGVCSSVEFNISAYLKQCLNNGYEGAIVRIDGQGYEAGRRSRSLIKVKQMLDDEFKVVDINPSKEGWAVLTCITPEGRTFGVSAPGTHEDKTVVLYNQNHYKGKYVTVEYSQLTKDKIPFHPVAIRWRHDL